MEELQQKQAELEKEFAPILQSFEENQAKHRRVQELMAMVKSLQTLSNDELHILFDCVGKERLNRAKPYKPQIQEQPTKDNSDVKIEQ
jgi:hypothetical protein